MQVNIGVSGEWNLSSPLLAETVSRGAPLRSPPALPREELRALCIEGAHQHVGHVRRVMQHRPGERRPAAGVLVRDWVWGRVRVSENMVLVIDGLKIFERAVPSLEAVWVMGNPSNT